MLGALTCLQVDVGDIVGSAFRNGYILILCIEEVYTVDGVFLVVAVEIESGTYETTKDVMLESANFHYANIRRSAHALGMLSDSSIRYSKGVNVENTEIGLKRALNIISTLGVGDISSVIVDNHNGPNLSNVFKSSGSTSSRLCGAFFLGAA